MTVKPINLQQQAKVITRTHMYIDQATAFFQRKFKHVEILFDLSGRNAGMYRVHGSNRCIRYNPYIFSRYFEDSLITTVPHEVAHYISDSLYGLQKIRPHGQEWKDIMNLFGARPDVTGRYDLQGIPQRRQKRYTYFCQCMEHQLSSVRHNRIIKKQAQYFCKHCHQLIQAGNV